MLCAECKSPMVPGATTEVPPGHVRLSSRGLCNACYKRAKRAGRLDKYTIKRPDPTARIEDLEFLLRDDHNAESVVRRAGFPTVKAAEDFARRQGRHDLVNKLAIYSTTSDVYGPQYGAAAFGVIDYDWRAAA